jgi:phasin family protein
MTQATKKTAAPKTDVNDTIAQARAAGENTVQAFAASGKAAFEGVIAYDKAVLGYTRVAFDDTVAHLRSALALKDVKELFEAHQAFAKSRYETVAAQGKELAELTRSQVEATVAPLRDAVPALKVA